MKKRILSIFLTAIMVVSLLPVTALAADTSAGLDNFKKVQSYNAFDDVKTSDWVYENVVSVYEFNLMIGRSSTMFVPDENMTVAEAMTIAARMHAIYHTGKATFTQGLPWYQVYTDYCKANGIADPDDYDLNAPVTRAQFAEIISNAFPKDAFNAINTVDNNMIPDVKAADEYGAAVYMLYRAGILIGNDDKGTFSPDSNILRMEVAAIITRMADPSLRKSVKLADESERGGDSGGDKHRASVSYTVRYLEAGTDKVLLDPVSGTGKVRSTVTLDAPMISGYTALTTQIDLPLYFNSDKNVATFYYERTSVPYAVHYIDVNTGVDLYAPYNDTGYVGSTVTLDAPMISGYTALDDYIDFVLDADPDNNVIIFYFEKIYLASRQSSLL